MYSCAGEKHAVLVLCDVQGFRTIYIDFIDIDLIRLGGLIGPICRSITSVLDSCLVKKHAGTLLPQMLHYVRAFHLLNRCSAIYVLVPVLV